MATMIFTGWNILFLMFLTFMLGNTLGSELVVRLEPHDTECFYESFATGDQITFEYQVIFGGRVDIDVQIYDPNNVLLHNDQRKQYDSVKILAASTGDFKFCFGNEFSTFTQKTVYFDLFKGDGFNALQEALPDPIGAFSRLETSTNNIHRYLMDIIDYQTHHRLREATGRSIAEELNNRVQVWSSAQSLLMIAVSVTQVYILKSFFNTNVNVKFPNVKYRGV
eukprot:Sdes_comp20962_c0_seq1m18728